MLQRMLCIYTFISSNSTKNKATQWRIQQWISLWAHYVTWLCTRTKLGGAWKVVLIKYLGAIISRKAGFNLKGLKTQPMPLQVHNFRRWMCFWWSQLCTLMVWPKLSTLKNMKEKFQSEHYYFEFHFFNPIKIEMLYTYNVSYSTQFLWLGTILNLFKIIISLPKNPSFGYITANK